MILFLRMKYAIEEKNNGFSNIPEKIKIYSEFYIVGVCSHSIKKTYFYIHIHTSIRVLYRIHNNTHR